MLLDSTHGESAPSRVTSISLGGRRPAVRIQTRYDAFSRTHTNSGAGVESGAGLDGRHGKNSSFLFSRVGPNLYLWIGRYRYLQ